MILRHREWSASSEEEWDALHCHFHSLASLWKLCQSGRLSRTSRRRPAQSAIETLFDIFNHRTRDVQPDEIAEARRPALALADPHSETDSLSPRRTRAILLKRAHLAPMPPP